MVLEMFGLGKDNFMIGAYYQCYNRDNALNFVLKNFRLHYPNSNLILVCDGGNDYTEEAKKFNCHYFYKEKLKSEKNLIFGDENSVKVFFERLNESLHLVKEDYFIILEDDVYVVKSVTEKDLVFDLNGCNIREFFSEKTNNLIRTINVEKKEKYFFGGCGGSIIKTKSIKKIFENFGEIEELISLYCMSNEPSRWASDQILSFIFLMNNLTIGNYEGFCETWYDNFEKRFNNNSIEVLHQYKKYYV